MSQAVVYSSVNLFELFESNATKRSWNDWQQSSTCDWVKPQNLNPNDITSTWQQHSYSACYGFIFVKLEESVWHSPLFLSTNQILKTIKLSVPSWHKKYSCFLLTCLALSSTLHCFPDTAVLLLLCLLVDCKSFLKMQTAFIISASQSIIHILLYTYH